MSRAAEQRSPGAERLSERDRVVETVAHLAHVLPGQGPIETFIHHNTLHGFQHLSFDDAVAQAEALFGASGYLSVETFRAHYRRGRISDADLDAVEEERSDGNGVRVIGMVGGETVTDGTIRRLHLVHGVVETDPATFVFLARERDATSRMFPDVPAETRTRALQKAHDELTRGVNRVGRDVTLGGWLGEVLGLDIVHATTRAAAAELAAGVVGPADEDHLLERMGVAPSQRDAYLALVARALASVDGSDLRAGRALWLGVEARLVESVARRHFDAPGRLADIEQVLRADIEATATGSLWVACVAAFGHPDPLAVTDVRTLGPRDPEAASDRLAEGVSALTHRTGRPVPLPPEDRARIESALENELDVLRRDARTDATSAFDPTARERAAATWFARRELRAGGCSPLGLAALRASARETWDPQARAAVDRLLRSDPRQAMSAAAHELRENELGRVGRDLSAGDILVRLTGKDVEPFVNRYMIRVCGAFLDSGQAAWRMPDRTIGLFRAWRTMAEVDATPLLLGVPGFPAVVAALPDDPADALLEQLDRFGIEPHQREDYLARAATRLTGWAAMVGWWGANATHPQQHTRPADLVQYLAIRLTFEAALVARGFRESLGLEAVDANTIAHWARAHPSEYFVRRRLQGGRLPTALAEAARVLERRGGTEEDWSELGTLIWSWESDPDVVVERETARGAWRLFRLAQLAGWSAGEVRELTAAERDRFVAVLDDFPEPDHRSLWLAAFERHYREEILGALDANRGKGRWQTRDRRPKAQVVVCIDEREESFHRAMDEMDPEYETFGSGGFFGIAMDFSGFDEHHVTPLCPAGVVPANRVKEVERDDPAAATAAAARRRRRAWRAVAEDSYWELKRNMVSGLFVTQFVGLLQSFPLVGRVLAPWGWGQLTARLERGAIPMPKTVLTVDEDEFPGLGFTPKEQADKVETQLRNIGMTHNFARLIVFLGHGSTSVNNPHESAHDCGACGGKHGGPNARAFAALANNPGVRAELGQRGIDIPADTHFVGGIHNTAHDGITYFDVDLIPEGRREEWRALARDLDEARARSARERCRRFYSAPKTSSVPRSLKHVEGRARDLSQVRPEWGHCTNAVAVVGRRALTQGLFLDRRTFVISYDPAGDPEGSIIERILMTVGPVGAGINLEYYFSSVDNLRFGCGTKVPHNVVGLIGVMDGAMSDLRTGLPKQMVEIHEAMRLLLVVEAPTAVLGRIYGAQPAIAELLDNEWLQLVSLDPDDGSMNLFRPGKGFVARDAGPSQLPVVASSYDWYAGHTDFLPPARIEPERVP
ncbi:MAG: putative inorganic carbon transporter subunit DabA [Actinomycetota bacterium]